MDTAGATFVKEDLTAKMGMFSANTAMFELNDHPVPVANLLGEEGNGFRVAMGALVTGRLSVAAGCLGVIEDCLAESVMYAKEPPPARQSDRAPSTCAGPHRTNRSGASSLGRHHHGGGPRQANIRRESQ